MRAGPAPVACATDAVASRLPSRDRLGVARDTHQERLRAILEQHTSGLTPAAAHLLSVVGLYTEVSEHLRELPDDPEPGRIAELRRAAGALELAAEVLEDEPHASRAIRRLVRHTLETAESLLYALRHEGEP